LTNYDVIGDIHGEYDVLVALLTELGYQERDGAWRKPGHQAVFVGDLIDRGAGQLEVLGVVRRMVDVGAAQVVMGNHEFNAIGWVTPDGNGDFCRPHIPKNQQQHAEFLAQVGEGSAAHDEWIEWFRTMPMWLDLGGVRVAHACWHDVSIQRLAAATLDEILLASDGNDLNVAMEFVLKGPEIDLGEYEFVDPSGHVRREARVRWWDPAATTLRTAAEIPRGAAVPTGEPFGPLPDTPIDRDVYPSAPTEVPVLYGHYWRPGHEMPPSIDDGALSACLDWSVAKGGPLVAYCWEGEPMLTADNLVAVRP
jgi:hypothetical protein